MKPKWRIAQIIDTLEEQAMLSRLRTTALEKVRSVTREDLKEAILEALSKPGAAAKNPRAIANEIIKKERKRLEEAVDDRAELKKELKKLYEEQQWKIERIARTESANAYTLSQLVGFREQGVVKVKWHSHTKEQRTCALCLSLDGTEHDVETLIDEGGRYPLSYQSHPNCRCSLSPVISHVTLESMEKMFEDEPEKFAPGQTVFDDAVLEMEEVVKEYQKTYGVELRNVPVEHEEEVKETLEVIRETPYQQHQPVELRFVKDVGATDEFKEAVELPEPVLGQVTAWTSPDNKLLVSQFSTDDGNTISDTLLRSWAAKVYEETAEVRRAFGRFHDRDEVGPAAISAKTVRTLLETFEPWTMAREQLVDETRTIALEKRLREAPEERLEKVLTDAGVGAKDRQTIIQWRRDRPVWTLDGQYVPAEGATGSEHNRFINRTAEQGPREMTIESVTAYVEDSWGLFERDPEVYGWVRDNVFDGKEFRD